MFGGLIYHRKKSHKSDSMFTVLIKKKGETYTSVVDSLLIVGLNNILFNKSQNML